MTLLELLSGAQLKLRNKKHPEGKVFTFQHLDGSYSVGTRNADKFCPICQRVLGESGKIIHLHFRTPIRQVGSHYPIDDAPHLKLIK